MMPALTPTVHGQSEYGRQVLMCSIDSGMLAIQAQRCPRPDDSLQHFLPCTYAPTAATWLHSRQQRQGRGPRGQPLPPQKAKTSSL